MIPTSIFEYVANCNDLEILNKLWDHVADRAKEVKRRKSMTNSFRLKVGMETTLCDFHGRNLELNGVKVKVTSIRQVKAVVSTLEARGKYRAGQSWIVPMANLEIVKKNLMLT